MTIARSRILIALGSLALAVGCPSAQQSQPVDDETISVSSFEEMHYPALARAARRESTVVVEVKLDGDGSVVSARAISGSKMLIPDTLSDVRKWRFHPNSSKTAVIIYEFHLVGGQCDLGRSGLFVFNKPNVATITACEMQRSHKS